MNTRVTLKVAARVVIACIAGAIVRRAEAAPDLLVYTNSAPASAKRGDVISVSDVTTNTSALSGAGVSTTYMYINTNLSIVGITPVGTHTVAALPPHGSYSWSGSVNVPTNQPTGSSYFITVCDKPNNVTESNENNNTNKCAIVINP